MFDKCKYDSDFYDKPLKNIILYTHFYKPATLNAARMFLENKIGYEWAPIDKVCKASETPCYCIIADDALEETRPYIEDETVYFAVIGRASAIPALYESGEKYQGTLPAAHTLNLIGTNDFFIPIEDIPIKRRLNHGWFHWRVPSKYNEFPLDVSNPETLNRDDWWNVLAWRDESDNGMDRPFQCTSYAAFASEFEPLKHKIHHKDIVVLPFNGYTFDDVEKDMIICDWAVMCGISCVIGTYALDTATCHAVAKRISLDKGLNELLAEFQYNSNFTKRGLDK